MGWFRERWLTLYAAKGERMRALIWIMVPLLIICVLLASRFVSWERLKGDTPQVVEYVNEGTALLRGTSRDYQGAIRAFSRAIEQNPKHALAIIRRGLAYYRLGEYRKAIADYNRALKLKRYQADAYYSRGDAHRELKDYHQAIADYTASLHERWAAFVMWKRAEVHLRIGDERRAIADYTAVIQRKGGAAAYYQRGQAYMRLHENELALDDFTRGIEIEPEFAEAHLSRAETYERLDRRQDAESDYLRVIELATAEIEEWKENHPILGPVYYRRGVAHQWLGNVKQARADYEMAVKLQTGGEIGREAARRLQLLLPRHSREARKADSKSE